MTKKAIILSAFVILAVTAAQAQYQSRVTGRVLDAEGNPVDKAEVSIVSTKTASIRYDLKTDKNGRFLQVGLTPGYFILTVKKDGFISASKEIHVRIADEEKFELTLKPMEAALERALSEADKLFLRANKLYAEQKFAEAAAAYEKAVEIDPANWGYRLNLGLAYKKAEKPDQALAAFRKSAELNPDSYSTNKETGEALARAGQFAEAKPFYEKAVGLSPGDPDAHFNLGVCLVNTGESEGALTHFQKTVELKSDYADAYYQMGTILIGQNKVPEARAALEKFLELAPDHEKTGIARQLVEFLKK